MFKVLRSKYVTTWGTAKQKTKRENEVDTVIGNLSGRRSIQDIILNDISENIVFDSQSKYKDINVEVRVDDGKRCRSMFYNIIKED